MSVAYDGNGPFRGLAPQGYMTYMQRQRQRAAALATGGDKSSMGGSASMIGKALRSGVRSEHLHLADCFRAQCVCVSSSFLGVFSNFLALWSCFSQLLTVGALHAFSPLLRSLTYSFSNDTVFALTVSCFTVSHGMAIRQNHCIYRRVYPALLCTKSSRVVDCVGFVYSSLDSFVFAQLHLVLFDYSWPTTPEPSAAAAAAEKTATAVAEVEATAVGPTAAAALYARQHLQQQQTLEASTVKVHVPGGGKQGQGKQVGGLYGVLSLNMAVFGAHQNPFVLK